MTINRRWIAREWLYLLAGFVWAYVLSPIFGLPLAALVLWIPMRIFPRLVFGDFTPLITFGPYVIFQLVRITRWAIRTIGTLLGRHGRTLFVGVRLVIIRSKFLGGFCRVRSFVVSDVLNLHG